MIIRFIERESRRKVTDFIDPIDLDTIHCRYDKIDWQKLLTIECWLA